MMQIGLVELHLVESIAAFVRTHQTTPDPITAFAARRVHTMDPSLPEATAVVVRNGRIVEVGDLEPSSGVAPSGR